MLRNAQSKTITLTQKNRKSTKISRFYYKRAFIVIVATTRLQVCCNFVKDKRTFIVLLLNLILRNSIAIFACFFFLLLCNSRKLQIQFYCF